MTFTLIVLLAGLFVVPALLLAIGHRLRKRTPRAQRAFWGAIGGHVVASIGAIVYSMIPPEEWRSGDVLRGTATFYALLVLPVIGALLGASLRRNSDETLARKNAR